MQQSVRIDQSREDFPELTKWELLKERVLICLSTNPDPDEKHKEEILAKLESKFGKTREELNSIFETKQCKRK